MKNARRLLFLGSIFVFAMNTIVYAQEQTQEGQGDIFDGFSLEDLLPDIKSRAVIMDIAARIVEQNQQVVFNSENTRVTIPGRPVGLKLVGANVVVAVQFTPYFRQSGNNYLVAQGQIWVNVADKGMSYFTTMQTIPLEFGEAIFFFPLGSDHQKTPDGEDARIEIQLVLYPYAQNAPGGAQETFPENGGAAAQ
jgi:hypothetical protein